MTGKIAITSSLTMERRRPLLQQQKSPRIRSPSYSSSSSSLSSLSFSVSPLPSPLPYPPVQTPRENRSVGECAGGTAAECAAVCCCFPLVVVEFMVLAFYQIPAGLCRRFRRKLELKRKMKKNKKKELLLHDRQSKPYDDATSDVDVRDFEMVKVSIDGSAEVINLDREMWEKFQNSGFWRSQSQRHL